MNNDSRQFRCNEDKLEDSLRLAKRITGLRVTQRDEVLHLLASFERSNSIDCDFSPAGQETVDGEQALDWPHAPVHRLEGCGTFMITTGTLHKKHYFCEPWRLDLLQAKLLSLAKDFQWSLEAWACFSNHYHFVGHAMHDAELLRPFLTKLHAETARVINERDGQSGRQVWFNFWDTRLTFEKSYLARLNYVHQNSVKHGLVRKANQYRWCSAGWFERTARPSQVQTIYSFRTDRLNLNDDFVVLAAS